MALSGLPAFEIHVKRIAAVPLSSIEIHWRKKLLEVGKWESGQCANNECPFCNQEELACIGDESHPLFLKAEHLLLVCESSMMCLIRGSKNSVLLAPEVGMCVCTRLLNSLRVA